MRFFKIPTLFLVALGLLQLAGCGGSGSGGGSAADPFASTASSAPAPAGQGNAATPPPEGPGMVLNYTMALSAIGSSGNATVGSNSTVTATATLKDSTGHMITNQPVLFEEVKGDPADAAWLKIPVAVVNTSSEGTATTFLQTEDTDVNRDVIVRASTTIDGKTISAFSIIRIVRSSGNYINFISTKGITDPDGNLNLLEDSVVQADPQLEPGFAFPQLVTFEVLDRNGINRTKVPVKLEVFKVIGGCLVTIGDYSSQWQSITTDDTGLGIFSAYIVIGTPPIGSTNTCSVIYKATTPDIYSPTPRELFSYGGFIVTLNNLE